MRRRSTTHSPLAASRARVVAAGDEARRRIQRDLHDGAQQLLVSAVMAMKLARSELGDGAGPAIELMDEALAHAQGATTQLRELAQQKIQDTNAASVDACMRSIAGTARSLGIEIRD